MMQMARFLLGGTTAFVLLCVAATPQTIVQSFDGDRGAGMAACQSNPKQCARPPEMNVAVSGQQIVQVTRQNVLIYSYGGKLLRSTPMTAFVKNAGLDPMTGPETGPIEPHVIYNEFLNRWIVTITCRNDCVIVSQSPDATGKWGGVYLSCLQGGPCLDRDPSVKLGYDKNGLYICAAHIGDDNHHTIKGFADDCFAVPAAEVAALANGVPPVHINRFHNLPLDTTPAIDQSPQKQLTDPEFFVAKSCDHNAPAACQNSTNFLFDWIVDSFSWTGNGFGRFNGNGEQVVKTDVGSRRNKWLYTRPCCEPDAGISQAGTRVRLRAAESHRLNNLVQFRSHLFGVLNSGPCRSGCGDQGSDINNVMFWVDMNCSNVAHCIVSRTGKISGQDFNPEFASVGVDKDGNLGIVAASSTDKTNLGVLLWTQRISDPPDAFQGPTRIIAGTQPYTCGNDKSLAQLGNAAGVLTMRDPRDGTKLWTTHQWSNDSRPCVWNTRIVEYQVAPANSPNGKAAGSE